VLDIIRARTDAGLRAAEAALRGSTGERVSEVRGRLIALLANIEAALDFSEEDIHFLTTDEVAAEIAAIGDDLRALVASYQRGKLLREGAATAIIGRPNTGKSSLLNALLREERAIVTEEPGTTRDIIEESIELGGRHSVEPVLLRLIDTAGIRHAHGTAERLGVARSRAALAGADLVLLVLDGSQPLTPDDEALLAEVDGRPAVMILNKADLSAVVSPSSLTVSVPVVSLSALTGAGLADLEGAIHALLTGGPPSRRPRPARTRALHRCPGSRRDWRTCASATLPRVRWRRWTRRGTP